MDVVALQDQLRARAFLHDDPDAYLAGVKDAVSVLIDDVEVRTPAADEKVETA